jgi:hypothetical protein
MTCKNTAQHAISVDGEAWYYENAGSIEVYVQTDLGIVRCKIHRAKLADWIKRTEMKKP